jgi:hypothetical protein
VSPSCYEHSKPFGARHLESAPPSTRRLLSSASAICSARRAQFGCERASDPRAHFIRQPARIDERACWLKEGQAFHVPRMPLALSPSSPREVISQLCSSGVNRNAISAELLEWGLKLQRIQISPWNDNRICSNLWLHSHFF